MNIKLINTRTKRIGIVECEQTMHVYINIQPDIEHNGLQPARPVQTRPALAPSLLSSSSGSGPAGKWHAALVPFGPVRVLARHN